MAQSQESTTSSGYCGSVASITASPALNPNYLCYWLASCKGQHELNQCDSWKDQLRGKLGIYYAPLGVYKRFPQQENLVHNNTGCNTVHLLVYKYEKKEVLFGFKLFKENKGNQRKCHPLLTFPSAKPNQRNGNMLEIPSRAFQWLTADKEFANQCIKQGLKDHFLFQNANVIYPVHLTNEQASILTRNFCPNKGFQSLHWLPLSQIRSQLPPWPNYIITEETDSELAQIQNIKPTGIQVEGHEIWYVAAVCLMCIREHVSGGFETFLKV